MNGAELRQFSIDIIKSWADSGMGRENALALWNEIDNYNNGIVNQTYNPPPDEPTNDSVQKTQETQECDPLKAELTILEGMSQDEQTVYILTEAVGEEQRRLDKLLAMWKSGDRSKINEVREQRKRVQVWSKRLNEAKAKLEKIGTKNKLSTS